ncbi:preprotein translocase subunit SecD [Rhizobium sp. SORGH_AS 787]|nr:preprotein translocase subunit SecD [Rhizobium sp. SORGH_AS_0787]
MSLKTWKNVVTIEIRGERRSYARINSTRDAASYLIEEWPGERDRSYSSAIISCTKALRGEAHDQSAMSAFINAASASGLRYMNSPTIVSTVDEFELAITKAVTESLADDLTETSH